MILAYYMIACGALSLSLMCTEAITNSNFKKNLGPYGRISWIFVGGWLAGWPTLFLISYWMHH